MRGRPPKAPQVKALEGNRAQRGKKRIPPPVRVKGAPVMPTTFTVEERRLWAFVTSAMPVDLLKKADSPIIERFVRAWRKYGQLQEAIEEQGLLLGDGNSPNPLIKVSMVYAKEMDITGQQLGLSPLSRSRLQGANDDGDENDIMDYLIGDGVDPEQLKFKQ